MSFNYQFQDFGDGDAQPMKKERMVLQEGPGSFVIVAVYDKRDGMPMMSKTSNLPMIQVKMALTDAKGDSTPNSEYITANAAWKLKTLLEAIGRADLYNPSGLLNVKEIVGGSGKCVIKTDAQYDPNSPRSVVAKYVRAEKQEPIVSCPDDDIPF